MADDRSGTDPAPPEDPVATVARQAAEIADLRQRLAGERFAADLRAALAMAAAAGTIASPVTHGRLLEMIVATAMQVIPVRAGALFLIDEASRELTFEVALGYKAEEARRFTVPLGRGIAGLVAVSGQPMAVSDVTRDPRHASEIGRSIGFVPESILCVPLVYDERVIGVLEFLDRQGAPSFGATDMEVLSHFANTAAVAIEQSRTHQNLVALVAEVLASLPGVAPARRAALAEEAAAFAAGITADPAYGQALELARLVQQIAWQGEAELTACRTILTGFAGYLRVRQARTDAAGGW